MSTAPDNLATNALEWALTHIKRFGDTDIFPALFEFEAVQHNWTAIRNELSTRDMFHYRTGPSRRTLVPKPGAGFRVAVQLDPLDPLDALAYTAIVYDAAEAVERNRIPADKNIACSYRIVRNADGNFFQDTDGWGAYHKRSKELASSGGFSPGSPRPAP